MKKNALELSDEEAEKVAGGHDESGLTYFTCPKCGRFTSAYKVDNMLCCRLCVTFVPCGG